MADTKQNPAYQVGQLLEKMNSTDKDFRFMATSDLISEFNKNNIKLDEDSERKVVRMMIKLLQDKNGEVQNLAVKCLGTLASRVRDASCDSIVDALCENLMSKKEECRDVSSIALRAFVVELTPGAHGNGIKVANRLVPKLHSILKETTLDVAGKLEVFDIIGEILLRNGSALASFHEATEAVLLLHLSTERPPVKKRASAALCHLAAVASPSLYNDIVSNILTQLRSPKQGDVKMLVTTLTGLVKSRSALFANFITDVVPVLLECVDKDEDELKEASIQSLEAMLVRCPRAMLSFSSEMEKKLASALAHDPNYAYDDEEEEENGMETEGDEEEDEDEEDEFDDDDDLSWKVRRAAAKTIESMICVGRDDLEHLFKVFGPLLISRFKEREENVRADVFSAYAELLKQLHAIFPTVESMSSEEASGVVGEGRRQLPSLLRSVCRLLRNRKSRLRQLCFSLLLQLCRTLPSSLSPEMPAILDSVCSSLTDRVCVAQMRIDVFSFVNEAIQSHPPSLFVSHTPQLVSLISKALADSFYKVSAEALGVAAGFLEVLNANGDSTAVQDHVRQIGEATLAKLRGDVDQEVKEKALDVVGILINLFGADPECMAVLVERLKNEATRHAAVRALVTIAEGNNSACLLQVLPTLIPFFSDILRKNGRAVKMSTLSVLLFLMTKHPNELATSDVESSLLPSLPPLLSESDLQQSQLALRVLSAAAESPALAARLSSSLPSLMVAIVSLLKSPLLQGATLGAFIELVGALAKATIAGKPTFEELLDQLSAPIFDVPSLPRQCFHSISASTAAVAAASDLSSARKLATKLAEQLGSCSSLDAICLFSLLTLGELGKRCPAVFSDSTAKPEDIITTAFKSSNEDIKAAAANALGCLAVGNLPVYLPFILSEISSQPKRQYLLLHALKEVLASETSSSRSEVSAAFRSQLEKVWQVLMKHASCNEEGTRAVVAECLGKLAHADPALLLPRLRDLVAHESVNVRAAVVTSVKFMISDEKRPMDEILQPMMGDFLSTINDNDLDVRRVALVVLNSAAHNKAELIRSRLPQLLPVVYSETNVRKELIREVEMGPFKHTVDGGLDLRKSAFECMYTLLDTCLDRLDIFEFLACVENGLKDQHDIKLLSYLTLNKLAVLCPTQLMQRMDKICEPLKAQLNAKPRSNAVKQEQDKADELKRAVLRTLLALQKMPEAERQQQVVELSQLVRHSTELRALLECIEKDAQRSFTGALQS